ncbi:MAG: polysaccharide export protein [Candidatus Omnitrophica bacterium]|nr:polysaccharide export protein [Candidatus Omnitrophota bacterium]
MQRKTSLIIILLFCLANLALAIPSFAKEAESEYRLQTEDLLKITVYEQPDLDITARITSNGEISFPLIGNVMASGLTVTELKLKIEELLRQDYLVNPQVQIFIEGSNAKQISVLGAVKKPGKYDMYPQRETTVLEAIAMAEGFSPTASINGTRIIRKEKDNEITIPIKVTDITKRGKKEKDLPLKPGDIVFVPESFF